jgi:hypothetical protein
MIKIRKIQTKSLLKQNLQTIRNPLMKMMMENKNKRVRFKTINYDKLLRHTIMKRLH